MTRAGRGRRAERNVGATMTLERDGDEISVEVTGRYVAGTPDVWYLPNGDPGYPGDPPEVDDIVATGTDGKPVELTDDEMEKAYDALIEQGREGGNDCD